MELLFTVVLSGLAYGGWMLLMNWVWDWASLIVWYWSYPIDAWIERVMEVPEDQRRFS